MHFPPKYDVFASCKCPWRQELNNILFQLFFIKPTIETSVEFNKELRPILKGAGLLTRDSREKERKKYGLLKARKAPQYHKR